MSPPSRRNRAEWLQHLANDLTKEEWRELRAILNERTFEFDIIGNLPIELVAQVCAYLPISDAPFCAYLVSKKWTEIFAQPIVQHALLSQWYSPLDPPLPGTAALVHDELFKVKLDHAARLLNAKPWYEFEEVVRNDAAEVYDGLSSQIRPYHYCSNALACISSSSPPGVRMGARNDTVTVWDLASRWKKVIKTAGREIMLTVTVTEELVGYVTLSGVLFALDRKSQETTSLNLPSAQVTALCGRKGALCVLIDSTIIIWQVKSRSVREFIVPSTIRSTQGNHKLSWNDGRDVQLLLASDANSIVLFVLTAKTSPHPADHDTLYACRFSLSGELLSMDSLKTRSFVAFGNNEGTVYHALGAAPCGYTGLRAVACASMELSDGRSLSDHFILFDELHDKFLQHETDDVVIGESEGQGVSIWKDVLFCGQRVDDDGFQVLQLCHPQGEPSIVLPRTEAYRYQDYDSEVWSSMHVFGDENVVVTVSFLDRYGQQMKITGFVFHKDLWDMQEETT